MNDGGKTGPTFVPIRVASLALALVSSRVNFWVKSRLEESAEGKKRSIYSVSSNLTYALLLYGLQRCMTRISVI